MSELSIFYSWQSDLPTATNWTFIEDALHKACRAITDDVAVDCVPTIDRDTKGVPGSPAIPAVIMEKIDNCKAFVADVSLCYDGPGRKRAPNPNVLFELGYALAKLTWDRILLVVNTEFGPIDDLPFDLDKRRAIGFLAREGEENRSEQKAALKSRFEAAIRLMIADEQNRPPARSGPTPAEAATEAIEEQSVSRRAKMRSYVASLFQRLQELQPDLRSSQDIPALTQSLEDSIASTGTLVAEFGTVVSAIALAEDSVAADEIMGGFGQILEEYDHKPGFSGSSFEYWFDYWRFVGHELFVVFIAHLMREEKWELIARVLAKQFHWQMHEHRTNNGIVCFDELSDHVRLLMAKGRQLRRASYHADLLKARHGASGIGAGITFREFLEADMFLYIAAELRVPTNHSWCHWRPWASVFGGAKPRFISLARRSAYAAGLALAAGATDIEALKSTIWDRVPKLRELWQGSGWHTDLTKGDVDAIGSMG